MHTDLKDDIVVEINSEIDNSVTATPLTWQEGTDPAQNENVGEQKQI
jgi:hypothetical protein